MHLFLLLRKWYDDLTELLGPEEEINERQNRQLVALQRSQSQRAIAAKTIEWGNLGGLNSLLVLALDCGA